MQLNKLIMAKKHTDISAADKQQMVMADIQANPRLLFTPEYAQWRDYYRRNSQNYVDSLFNNLPKEVQDDIYNNDREGFGALSDKAKNTYRGNKGATMTREGMKEAGNTIGNVFWDEVVPYIPILGTGKDWYDFYQDPTLGNLSWALIGTAADSGVVKGVKRIVNGVKGRQIVSSVDNVADARKSQFVSNFDIGKLDANVDLSDLVKRGLMSSDDAASYAERIRNASKQEIQPILDEIKYKTRNEIAKGVGLTVGGFGADAFIANEQQLQNEGLEPWLIDINNQPWSKYTIEDVPLMLRGVEPDSRGYANGGRLMITKRNTYKPHYFEDGSLMRGTMQTSIPIETAGINPQGVPNGNNTTPSGSGMNWGNVGWGAAGAASGLMGQIGVSEKNPNGLWDAADPMHYLANGRTSKFGEGASKLGIGLTQAGLQSGNPWLAVAGAAVKIVGDLGNAGWGHKTNEEQLARVNQGIDAANNFQSNAYSFDTLQDPMTLASAGNVYEGGWFNKKKWERKNDELQANTAKAQANVYNQFSNNLNNLQQDQMSNMLANYAAFGGTLSTQGSDWRTGLTFVGNGGSHESNPYGGVPMGIAPDGQPNLVEEGEVIYDLNGSPYVYSKRLKMSQAFKDKYKFKGETFADAATQAEKEIEERPNDPIAKRGLDDMMGIIAGEQEKERQKRAERQARKQAKQATYAYGGHIFEDGGRPKKLILKRKGGNRTYTLGDDGMYYTEGMRKGLSWSEIEPYYNKYYFSADEDITEPTTEPMTVNSDTIPTVTELPQQITGKTLRRIEDADSDYYPGEGVTLNTTSLYGYAPADDWSYWGLNDAYTGKVGNRTFTAEEIEKVVPNTILVTKDANGNPIVPELQTMGEVYDPSKRSRSYTVNQTAEQPVVSNTAPATSVSTSTSKSTSTGKGTTTNRGTTTSSPVDYGYLLDWMGDEANFAAANAAATKNGARNFTNAADLYKTATTGKPGPAMRGLLSAYNDFQNANRGGINYNPYNEGSSETEALSSIPVTNSIPTLGSLSPERYQDTESTNRLNYFTSLYGNRAAKKLEKAGFNPDGTRREGYTDNGIADNDSNHRATWMRYAPVVGSALAVLTDPWLNKPDYKNADMVLEAGNSAKDVSFNPIGDYLSYRPFDRLFYANQLAAQQAATRRSLLNTTGGNASTARGLLLAADNQGINQMGNLWRQAEEYNEANRQAVAEFNRGTNMFNSEGFLKADMANQGQGNVKINAAIEAAKLRELEDNRVAETRSANFTNLFNNLGNIGRENFVWNQVNENPAVYYGVGRGGSTIYKGNSDGYDIFQQNMDRWNKEHTGALGGYITIK